MLTRIACLTACFLVVLILLGCQKQTDTAESSNLVFPRLQSLTPVSFTLTEHNESIVITQKDNRWWVGGRLDYPANSATVDWFLQTLKDTEIGKPIELDSASRSALLLDQNNGLVVNFEFERAERSTYVFGELEMKRNPEESLVVGVGVTSHRYVRRIDEQGDASFLLPVSMVGLAAGPDIWVDPQMIRVPTAKVVTVSVDDTLFWKGERSHPFGKLIGLDRAGQQPFTGDYACFENFLKGGVLDSVSRPNTDNVAINTLFEVTITDFLGARYRFKFGSPELPDQPAIERAATQASFTNDGRAITLVPFTVTELQKGKASNAVEMQLDKRNHSLADQLKGMMGFVKYEQFACLHEYVGK